MDSQTQPKRDLTRRLIKHVREADTTSCALLLAEGADPNEKWGTNGSTALIAASEAGALGCVRLLLAHGADPKLGRKHAVTPLMVAAAGGHEHVIFALLALSDPMAKSDHGNTAFLMAVKAAQQECLNVLWDGSDKGAADSTGKTALMAACSNADEELVLRLLPFANPQARDSMNRTAADHAQEAGLGNFAARLRALEEADALAQNVPAAPAARARPRGL